MREINQYSQYRLRGKYRKCKIKEDLLLSSSLNDSRWTLRVTAATNGDKRWDTISDTCAQKKVIETANLLINNH